MVKMDKLLFGVIKSMDTPSLGKKLLGLFYFENNN